MFTEEKNIEKICSFYASEYHLEMIMIPYINKKIEEKANIRIITDKDLSKTAKEVLEKTNLSKETKEKIANLNWKNTSIENLRENEKNRENVVFVIGEQKYIKSINNKLKNVLKQNSIVKVINCFSIDDIKGNMPQIVRNHSKILNTTEEKEIG